VTERRRPTPALEGNLRLLEVGLQEASDCSGGIDKLFQTAILRAGKPPSDTAFPGFQDEPGSTLKFNQIVQNISAFRQRQDSQFRD
jgi:hypothetical protein